MSYLKSFKKTFDSLTKKTTKKEKKKKVRRDRERNQRDRQRTFEKVRSDSYMFLKIKIRSIERNRVGLEMYMKKGDRKSVV